MSLPSSGWLPPDVLTEITTPVIPLPTPFVGSYTEGGASLAAIVPQAFKELVVHEIGANHLAQAGYSAQRERTLVIQLIRDEVFGAILVDLFTPPVLSTMFFEFDAYTQLACVNGLVASVPLFGSSQSGTPVDAVEVLGTPTTYTEEP